MQVYYSSHRPERENCSIDQFPADRISSSEFIVVNNRLPTDSDPLEKSVSNAESASSLVSRLICGAISSQKSMHLYRRVGGDAVQLTSQWPRLPDDRKYVELWTPELLGLKPLTNRTINLVSNFFSLFSL